MKANNILNRILAELSSIREVKFEQVFPEMISAWKDEPPEGEEPYKSVAADLIPVLTKAIQELKAINDAQATRIETLEAQNAAFEARLAALEAK